MGRRGVPLLQREDRKHGDPDGPPLDSQEGLGVTEDFRRGVRGDVCRGRNLGGSLI